MVELNRAQVEGVIRATATDSPLFTLLTLARDRRWRASIGSTQPSEMENTALSRSLLSGLFILSRLPPDRGYVGVAELARALCMSQSTVHRYLSTLVVAGLIEREPATRLYRLVCVR